MKPIISLIAAVSKNGVIGADNAMPWHISEDFKYFKRQTLNKPVIMGRKTFESIGRPLPKRPNIVITRQSDYAPEGVTVVRSLEEALSEAKKHNSDEIMVIGGGQIYDQSIKTANRLYITEVNMEVQGDAKFPDIDKNLWQEKSRDNHKGDPSYSFVIYEK